MEQKYVVKKNFDTYTEILEFLDDMEEQVKLAGHVCYEIEIWYNELKDEYKVKVLI